QKALLRCLVDKVVVQRRAADTVQVRIVWKGGETSTAAVPVSTASWSGLSGAGEIEAAVIRLAGQGKTDREIARELTHQGCRSPRTCGVSAHMVLRIRLRQRVLRDRRQAVPHCIPGYLTVAQLAGRLHVSPFVIYARIESGRIEIVKHAEWKRYLFPDAPRTITMMQQLLAGKIQKLRCTGGHQDG